jgi:hypothetical protein
VPALAQDQPEAKAWEAMVKKILGDAKPTEGKVAIDMAEIAENGNTVAHRAERRKPDDGQGLT